MSRSISRSSAWRRSSSENVGRGKIQSLQMSSRGRGVLGPVDDGRTPRGPPGSAGTGRPACRGTASPRRGRRAARLPRARAARRRSRSPTPALIRRVPGCSSRAAAFSSLACRSASDVATIARRSGLRRAAEARATSVAATSPSVHASAAAPRAARRARAPPRPAPRPIAPPAGTARCPTAGRCAGAGAGASSRIAWALMPPKPKALMPARRGSRRAVDPRAGARAQVERRALQAELRVGPLHVDRRRQHAMVQRERELDHAGHPGGRDRVADHRLDGAERAARQAAVALAEHLGERLDLGDVADRRARCRAPRAARCVAGSTPACGVGAPQRQHLALDARRHDAHAAPVAGHADAADHRVDPVAVALGVLDALEHEHADALAEQRAVGVLVERGDALAARKRAELAEHVQRRHRHPDLRAAGQREVTGAVAQVGDRRAGRRRARRRRRRRPCSWDP